MSLMKKVDFEARAVAQWVKPPPVAAASPKCTSLSISSYYFLWPSPGLAAVTIWEVKQQMEHIPPSLILTLLNK